MAYRADIEIGVRGAKELLQLQKQLDGTSYKIEQLNKKQVTFFGGIAPSINNFNRQLAQATRALNSVAAGTPQETRAVNNYVTALENANEARQRQNRLIQEEIVKRNGATAALQAYNAAAAAPTRRGAATTMTGAYLRGQPRFGPQPAPGFNPAAGAGRTRARILSLEAISSGERVQAEFAQKGKIFEAEASFNKKISEIKESLNRRVQKRALTGALDNAMEEFRVREKNADELFKGMMRDNDKLIRKFDNDLKNVDNKRAKRARQRSQLRENLALGAGFPLLTGGGPGAVTGGVLGAIAGRGGSGFGLQILFSAIGQQIDRFVQAQSQVAAAISETTDVFGALESAGFKVSGALKNIVRELEQSGNAAAAYRLKQNELQKAYGVNALRDLSSFDRANQRVADSFKRINATLLPPLLRIFTALADISAAGLNSLAVFFEFLAGPSAKGGNVRPDFRMAGGFAEADAQTRDLVRIREEGISNAAKEEQQIIEDINNRQERLEAKRVAARNKVVQFERKRRDIINERQRVEMQSLQNQLRLQSLITSAETKRLGLVIKTANAEKAARLEIARAQIQAVKEGAFPREFGPSALAGLAEQERASINDRASQLAFSLVGGSLSQSQQQELVQNYKNSLLFVQQIVEAERERLFITKDEAYQKRTDAITAETEILNAVNKEEADRLRLLQLQAEVREEGVRSNISEDVIQERISAVTSKFLAENRQANPLREFITQSINSLEDLRQTAVNVSQGIGNAIGSSLVNGLQSLVTGAASIKQVFADLLKSVADVLANTAAKMIAQYIAIGIARAFAGMGSDPAGSQGNPFGSDVVMPGPGGSAVDGGRIPLNAYADGGYVSGPTRAVIGEGGESEYIIPESKMRESMARYSRGARGSAVIPETGASGTSGEGGGTAVAAPIDVRYTVERINNVDYVTADQFQRGMQSAATQGAKQGEQNTLKRLQMSGSTRKRLGL